MRPSSTLFSSDLLVPSFTNSANEDASTDGTSEQEQQDAEGHASGSDVIEHDLLFLFFFSRDDAIDDTKRRLPTNVKAGSKDETDCDGCGC